MKQKLTISIADSGYHFAVEIPKHNGVEARTIYIPFDTAAIQLRRLLIARSTTPPQVGTPSAPTVAQAIMEAQEIRRANGLQPVPGQALELTKRERELEQKRRRWERTRREAFRERSKTMTGEELFLDLMKD